MSSTRSIARREPAIRPPDSHAALVVCAHGINGDPGAAVAHARTISRLKLFAEARACCLSGRPQIADVLAELTESHIYLVPNLMSEGYTNNVTLPRLLGLEITAKNRLTLCRPVGTNPRLATLIVRRAVAGCLTNGWEPRETALLLVAHGTRRVLASSLTARRHAAAITETGTFASADAAFLEEPPSVAEALRTANARHVVCIGLFADHGAHGEGDVSRLLSASRPDGFYAGPIGADPDMAGLIAEQAWASMGDSAVA
jgi:sirohydrochlorin cobaltochelatase